MAEDYKVGYKNPPRDKQFKKGQSGNPGGRPKGSKNKKPFFPISKTIHEFQKMIIDVGEEEINISKKGEIIKVTQMEALLMQLYQKGLQGNIATGKLVLQLNKDSMEDLQLAAKRVMEVTKRMRSEERKKIFSPLPQPNTFGMLLKRKHEKYSDNFVMREAFGPDKFMRFDEDEPEHELDWAKFNSEMRKDYLSYGNRAVDLDIDLSSKHSIFEL